MLNETLSVIFWLLTVNFWGCFLFIPGSPGGNSSWHILCNASFIVIHSWSRGRIRWHGRRGWGRSHTWGSIGSFGIPYFVQQLQTQPHIEVTGEDEALIEHPLGTGPFARVFCQAYFDEAAMKENKTYFTAVYHKSVMQFALYLASQKFDLPLLPIFCILWY